MVDHRAEIHFSVYKSPGEQEIFYFYTLDSYGDWIWDDYKRSLDEALEAYPLDTFKWISIRSDD